MGLKWRGEQNIRADQIHKCGRYKLCIYCGKQNYKKFEKKYQCDECKSKGYGLVICSKECHNKHIEHLHKSLD